MNIAETRRPVAHPAFEGIREARIPALNLTVQHFVHRETGALHYHLASDNPENVFLVAFRTVPEDSTGVAHILEHTALCGSERYPVRDPFFMMLRRSLNTFMNAFTSSDWTAYPFASQNRKDFTNLLDVYLDAAFFSRLDPLDFAQEGHRVEFAEPDDPTTGLVYRGVVYNEMKGAMSSPVATLWQTLCEHLFPTSTYHHNSGGDPAEIPSLTYEQLTAFYRSHYHPSNAIFMTFGDIPATEHQAVFEDRALGRFQKLDERIAVTPEQRFAAPTRVTAPYACDEGDDLTGKTHVVLGWMLGESADLEAMLEAQLLTSVLLENSASPLQHALETTALGSAPSPLCGLEDGMREMVFCCGIEGSEADRADDLEALVLTTLERVAREGVPQEQVEAVLHQLELHQREVGGDGFPYGLSLMMQAIGSATHYSDPIAALDLEPALEALREKIRDPDYLPTLTRRLLLDNTNRVTLVMTPDATLAARRAEAEQQRLAALRAALNPAGEQAIVERAAALKERQGVVDDISILPRVTLADVPAELPRLAYHEDEADGLPVTTYETGTNGLVYQQLVAPLPALSEDELALLPHYTGMATELGLGEADYLATQHRQSAAVGGISVYTSMRGDVDNAQQVRASLVLSSKALQRKAGDQLALMRDTRQTLRFDELPRLRELVAQQRARRDQAITGQGHSLAMAAASAGMSPMARLHHSSTGLEGLRRLRILDRALGTDSELQAFAGSLEALHGRLTAPQQELLTVTEPGTRAELLAAARTLAAQLSADGGSGLALAAVQERRGECWLTNTQVNFCARAYPTVPVGHPDAAALTVLAAYLRNGFLHRAIREQGGAYGGGASQDSSIAAFRFFSYRDPRLEETLDDFDASIRWLLERAPDPTALEEAVLGVIASFDKPGSPAGEARQDFHNRRFGRNHERRMAFRQQVLAISHDDLVRVASEYLVPERASTAVITGTAQRDATAGLREALGLTLCEL
ncbi:insulinase family protein [Pseudohaliea rubra]|uniref:Metalloprotease, insulinase family n=1 Tax=Pseudohaliea rubra DSM 19751 TaxID=1265313 RepID=A0A095VUU8_9GAMM|nr:insulinase family protein [Pseudohaliea rubra]KGE05095.1 metalloprotease, insulinase family [Pseudohaliea rubra DSM 19751]